MKKYLLNILTILITGGMIMTMTASCNRTEKNASSTTNSSISSNGSTSVSNQNQSEISNSQSESQSMEISSSSAVSSQPAPTAAEIAWKDTSRTRIIFDKAAFIAPKTYDVPALNKGDYKAIYYEGLNYKGAKTRVFAYIGIPKNASASNKVPAVVLAHGGGGTAFSEWVNVWVNAGYAAIAMDLEGNIPDAPGAKTFTRHQWGGPVNSNYKDINIEMKDQWMYHAVADVYLAHSLLAADTRIDKNKIGISGISWGGVITSIAISNADIFSFAVPIYGGAYLKGSKGYQKQVYNTKVADKWDAANWLRSCKTPTLWINGDSDTYFSIDSTTQSFLNTKNANLLIKPSMVHDHPIGWGVSEAYVFANSITKGETGLCKITSQPEKTKHNLTVQLPEKTDIDSVTLKYTTTGITYDTRYLFTGIWETKEIEHESGPIIHFDVPAGTKAYYVIIRDNNNNEITSKVVFY